MVSMDVCTRADDTNPQHALNHDRISVQEHPDEE